VQSNRTFRGAPSWLLGVEHSSIASPLECAQTVGYLVSSPGSDSGLAAFPRKRRAVKGTVE
jgi:hypothetical protein